MEPIDEMRIRIERLEAERQLERLAYEYNHGIDKRDIDRFLRVWHPDAEWVPGPGLLVNGVEEIRQTVETGIWPAFSETHHWATNVVVDIDGDTATGVCDVNANVRDTDGQWLRASATYNDTFALREGTWRYTRREAVIHFQEPLV